MSSPSDLVTGQTSRDANTADIAIDFQAPSDIGSPPVMATNLAEKRADEEADAQSSDDDWPDTIVPDMNADQVRRRIRAVVDNGDFLVKDLQQAMNVGPGSYGRFMRQHGPDKGMGSDCFIQAFKFFKKREEKGIVDRKKAGGSKKKADSPKNKGKASGSPKSAGKKRKGDADGGDDSPRAKKKSRKDSLNDSENDKENNDPEIVLDGEVEDTVPVYESCDVVRRKVDAHLRKSDVTNAAFLREISKLYHTEEKKVTSQQLTRFRSAKGADKGNTNPVFYASYVYFEKERLKAKKPKTKHREMMEEIWAKDGGFDVKTNKSKQQYYCVGRSRPEGNQYGQIFFTPP